MTNETAAIESTITRYFRGMKEADVDLLKSAFHEHAGFFGPFGDQLIAAPISHLYDWVAGNLTPDASGSDHEIDIDNIEVQGPIAMARCTEKGFLGHDFAEYFTLLKTDDGWKITNKSYAAA
jgi:hypothetical protein